MEEELLRRISESFNNVPRPSYVTKSVARALDEEWEISEDRVAELRHQDLENHWRDLSDGEIEDFQDIMPFLDSEAFRFYLPAFMSYTLRRYHNSSSTAMDSAIYNCAIPCGRFEHFSPAQMRCILDFLTFCACDNNHFDASWAAYAVDFLESSPLNAPQAETEQTTGLSTPAVP